MIDNSIHILAQTENHIQIGKRERAEDAEKQQTSRATKIQDQILGVSVETGKACCPVLLVQLLYTRTYNYKKQRKKETYAN